MTDRATQPLTLAALGGLFSERAGVVNIGLEGSMLFGAFFGMWWAAETGSWVLGLAGALVVGALVGLLHGFFCIQLQADQIVVVSRFKFTRDETLETNLTSR